MVDSDQAEYILRLSRLTQSMSGLAHTYEQVAKTMQSCAGSLAMLSAVLSKEKG